MGHVANEAQMRRYLEIMESTPHYYLTQSPEWHKVKQNWTPDYFVSELNNKATAASMLTILNPSDNTGLAYMARGPVAQPDDLDNIRAIISSAYQVAKDRKATTLRINPEWDSTPENQERLESLAQEFGGTLLLFPQYTAQPVIDVIGNLENLSFADWFSGLSKQTRTNYRAALRRNAKAIISTDSKYLEVLYDLIVLTSERQKITHRPKSYFHQLIEAFPNDYFFCLTNYEGRIISASLNIICTDTVYFLYAGNEIVKGLNGAHLMHIEIFAETIRRNIKYVNMGGVFQLDDKDGLYSYKRRLAGKDSAKCFVGEINITL